MILLFSARYSLFSVNMFPVRYISRIHEMLPESEWEAFFEKVMKPLPKTVRLCEGFDKVHSGWKLDPVSLIPDTYFVRREDQAVVPLGKTLEHFSGQVYVASLSSLLPPLVLDPSGEDLVLDVCSAPGSKATFMADLMGQRGLLVVNELSSSRSKKLVSNIERMGVLNSVLLQSDGVRLSQYFDQQFSKILLDAPCSSEGFARKDSKYFDKMWREKKIFAAAKLQKKLIVSAFEVLAPDGVLVYSTCTAAPEENEAVVQHLLDKYPDEVEVLPVFDGRLFSDGVPFRSGVSRFFDAVYDPVVSDNVVRIWPHLETERWSSESFFIAKIRKKSLLCKKSVWFEGGAVSRRVSLSVLSKNRSAEILSYLCKHWGFERDLFRGYVWVEKNNSVWLVSREAARFAVRFPHRRFGFPVLDEHRCLTSVFAIRFGVFAKKNFLMLSVDQKKKWLQGGDLCFDPVLSRKNGEMVLVCFDRFCLGVGKVLDGGGKVKNRLDRGLVMG